MSDTRTKMIETVHALMDEHGLAGVQARRIAQAVGVSVGTVYNTFGSLDGLIQSANAATMADFAIHARPHLEASRDADLRTQLLALSTAYLDYLETRSARWSAMLTYNRDRTTEAAQEYMHWQTELLGWIGAALSDTRFDTSNENRETAARTLWSGLHGIVALNYLGFESPEQREVVVAMIELYVDTVVRGSAGEPVN